MATNNRRFAIWRGALAPGSFYMTSENRKSHRARIRRASRFLDESTSFARRPRRARASGWTAGAGHPDGHAGASVALHLAGRPRRAEDAGGLVHGAAPGRPA